MDGPITFGIAMAALNAILIPVLKVMWDKTKDAEALAVRALEKLNEHKLHVAQDYISLAMFEKFEERLFDELETIKGKLDRKADK